MNSIYTLPHGLRIDLDKIVFIGPVMINEYNDHSISIQFQMLSEPTNFSFKKSDADYVGEVEVLINAITLKSIKFDIYHVHRDLIDEWHYWKMSKKKSINSRYQNNVQHKPTN